MISKEKVIELANVHIENTDLFIVDLNIGKDNKITVFLDGDNGVTVKDCIDVSRAIEHNLDREQEDFELNVMSFGVGEPLKMIRQYKKNISRDIEVISLEGQKVEGELIAADDEKITVSVPAKKKKDAPIEAIFLYEQIKEARIIISFK